MKWNNAAVGRGVDGLSAKELALRKLLAYSPLTQLVIRDSAWKRIF